jgi:hypothetical protein
MQKFPEESAVEKAEWQARDVERGRMRKEIKPRKKVTERGL